MGTDNRASLSICRRCRVHIKKYDILSVVIKHRLKFLNSFQWPLFLSNVSDESGMANGGLQCPISEWFCWFLAGSYENYEQQQHHEALSLYSYWVNVEALHLILVGQDN